MGAHTDIAAYFRAKLRIGFQDGRGHPQEPFLQAGHIAKGHRFLFDLFFCDLRRGDIGEFCRNTGATA